MVENHFRQSLLAKEAQPKVLHQIDVDINRSARNHAQFHERFGRGSVCHQNPRRFDHATNLVFCSQICLFNVLKAYSILDKQVGYCQSMSDVTAILLMYVEEEVRTTILPFSFLFNQPLLTPLDNRRHSIFWSSSAKILDLKWQVGTKTASLA